MKRILILGARHSGKTTVAEFISELKTPIFEEISEINDLNNLEYIQYRLPYSKQITKFEEAIFTSNSITVEQAEKFGFKKVIVFDYPETVVYPTSNTIKLFLTIPSKEIVKITDYCKITKQPLVILVKEG